MTGYVKNESIKWWDEFLLVDFSASIWYRLDAVGCWWQRWALEGWWTDAHAASWNGGSRFFVVREDVNFPDSENGRRNKKWNTEWSRRSALSLFSSVCVVTTSEMARARIGFLSGKTKLNSMLRVGKAPSESNKGSSLFYRSWLRCGWRRLQDIYNIHSWKNIYSSKFSRTGQSLERNVNW